MNKTETDSYIQRTVWWLPEGTRGRGLKNQKNTLLVIKYIRHIDTTCSIENIVNNM